MYISSALASIANDLLASHLQVSPQLPENDVDAVLRPNLVINTH